MLGKVEILIVIIVLLLTFYFVIAWGAGKNKDSKEIKRYLFGVRFLISVIVIVSLILWLLL